jgi:hypothetical protein
MWGEERTTIRNRQLGYAQTQAFTCDKSVPWLVLEYGNDYRRCAQRFALRIQIKWVQQVGADDTGPQTRRRNSGMVWGGVCRREYHRKACMLVSVRV